MADTLDIVKAQVREMRPYSLRPERARVKLNQNENPWDVPLEIKEETLSRIAFRKWSRYPDFVTRGLHEQLAKFSGWKTEGVLSGNGSNELIQAVLMVIVGEQKRVLISEPTFALYRQITRVLGGKVISINLTPELTYDIGALRATIRSARPDVTIICSPNNPTGCVIGQADLESLLEETEGLIVIDEAYFEFSGQTAVPLLERHSNLVVLRTFSKAMALAGLRVGYLLAAPELVREIAKALLPYNLNVISQTAAEVAIEMYESKLQPLIATITSERDRLYRELQRIPGLAPVPSRANFMVVRSQIGPGLIFEGLLERGILIRDVSSYPLLSDYFRISVGTTEENDLLLQALKEICG